MSRSEVHFPKQRHKEGRLSRSSGRCDMRQLKYTSPLNYEHIRGPDDEVDLAFGELQFARDSQHEPGRRRLNHSY